MPTLRRVHRVRRTGIDLSSRRCIVVDAEMQGRRRIYGEHPTIRVHQSASFAHTDSAQALTAELKVLAERKGFSRRAWVNLWDVPSRHHYLLLPSAGRSELDAMARRYGASLLGLHDTDVTVGTIIGSTRGDPGHQKTELSFFAAASEDVRQQLRPVVQAGFLVEGVTTPCGALWSQAKLRRPTVPGEVHAYVVLGVSTSALAIFSKGFLLYGRDFNWGYAVPDVGIPVSRDRSDLAAQLAAELRQSFLYVKQYWEEDVSQVLLCGEMPEIRSLTAPLIELLNIEVETLDTLDGIDTSNLPEGFAEDAAAFRLASSIAVEPPPANLLPVQMSAQRVNRRSHRVFAAGSAAAVACAAFLYGHASVVIKEAEREIHALRLAQSPSNSETLQRTAVKSPDGSASRMARVLEVLPATVPGNVIIRSLRALPAGDSWHVSIEAVAGGPDLTHAQRAIDTFLRALQNSPLFGPPLRPPLRLVNDAGAVELTAEYSVRK